MTKAKKHHFAYRLWIKLRGLLALVVVLAGLTVGLISLLLPFESLYQQRLINFLEQQWNLTVEVAEIKGSWRAYGPYFSLSGLELRGKQNIQLDDADLYINVYQLLIPGGRTGIDLSINQAELDMIQAADGANITLANQAEDSRISEVLDRVLTTGALRVNDLVLNLTDESGSVILEDLKADLLLEQDNDFRALRLDLSNDIEGKVEVNQSNITIKAIGPRKKSLINNAQWHVSFKQFDLTGLQDLIKGYQLPSGTLDGEVWLDTAEGEIQSINGSLNWNSPNKVLTFEVLIAQQLQIETNQLMAANKNWQAMLKIQNIMLNNEVFNDFELLLRREEDVTAIKSSDIPLSWLTELAKDILPGSTIDLSSISAVEGELSSLYLSYDHVNQFWQGGHIGVNEVSINHPKFMLKGISADYEFSENMGQLLIDSTIGSLTASDVYRGTLNWQELNAQISVNTASDTPDFTINNLWCQCDDFKLQLWAGFKLKDQLQMFLSSRLSDVKVGNLHKYWPHKIWKDKTIQWLDNGLLDGQVDDAFVVVIGDMIHKGFKKGAAQFYSRAFISEVGNLFHPQWPVVQNIEAVAEFDQNSAHIQLKSAQSKGLMIKDTQVDIESFDAGIVAVDLNADTRDNQILDYIRISPLINNIEVIDSIKVGGKQEIKMAFEVAIKPEINQEFNPQGSVTFNNGQFFTEHFVISDINGPVKLSGYQLSMQDLPAKLDTAEVTLNGDILTKSDQGVQVDVDLNGSLDSTYLLDLIHQDLPITGESDWLINIKNAQEKLTMKAQSMLAGLSISLPAPLDKPANEDKTLEIKCNLPCAESSVEINYNNEIKSTIISEAGQYHLTRLQFIDSVEPEASQIAGEELFGGYIETLNLDQWMQLLATQNASTESTDEAPEMTEELISEIESNNPAKLPVDEFQLKMGQMIFMSRAFNAITLDVKRESGGYIIQIDSEAIKGQVMLDDDLEQKGIVAEFEYLDWIDVTQESLKQTEEETTSSEIPDVHLWAKEFSYAGIELGELRMEVRNVADGIKIDQLSLRSELAEINISGSWNKADGGKGQSKFHIVMISEKVADFLMNVGFNAPLSNAQTLIDMTAQWNDVPSEFNIAEIDGDLEIKIGQGQVLDQKPGFGRVLGLFNLTNLPRRLILDFRDVLADGLLFSSMEGRFKVTSGVAHTDDFMIKASSAKIHIKGDVGFADQSYDQVIVIRPQIGKTFPTIGAIAGGPVGAAAGFLVQGLLGKKLKNSSEIIYHVTGSWDDPIIELIDKNKNQNNEINSKEEL